MEKPQAHSYGGAPSAPDPGFSHQYGYPGYQGYPPQHGCPSQQGFPPQQPGTYPQPGQHPPGTYPPGSYSAGNYPPVPAQTYQPGSNPGINQSPCATCPHAPQAGASPPGPRRGWCEDSRRNKPQSNSLGAASLIFTSGGMSWAWSVGFTVSEMGINSVTRTHMRICWFIGIIIGAILAALLINALSKRMFYMLGSILVLINGILVTSSPTSTTAIIIARYCDGIAFGLILVPAIMAGSEQAVARFRGLVLSVEQAGVATGMMVKIIYTNLWGLDWEFDSNQLHGILVIVYGVVALLFTFTLTIESSSTFLRKNDETTALNVIRWLETPKLEIAQANVILSENKRMLEEDAARGKAENITRGLLPVIKVAIFRSLVSMSFSLPLSYAFVLASLTGLRTTHLWSTYIYGVMRVIGILVAVFTLDSVGRKFLSMISILICGGLLMGVGSIYSTIWNVNHQETMITAVVLLIIFQFFAGIAAPASTCYLGEAFSISVKPYFIAIAVVVENVVQIVICSSTNSGGLYSLSAVSDYAYAFGAISIGFSILSLFTMPETKKLTLRQALDKFGRGVHNYRH